MDSPSDVANQVKKFWSDIFEKELREDTLLPGLVSRNYEGEIKQKGDTVYVTQVNAANGEIRDIGTDSDSFTPEALSVQRIAIVVNKRIVASYEFEDLMDIQTQLSKDNPEILASLKFAVEKQLNDYLYTLVAPSSSAPDHTTASVTDFNLAQLSAQRILAAQAKWNKLKPWYCLLDPVYYGDVLTDTTLANTDFGGNDAPIIAGQISLRRMGFNILEDNSDGILTISSADSADCALLFHPDFMHLVMGEPRFKISDLHSNKQFGFVLSVDMLIGAALGNDGAKKHITVQNNA